VIWNSASMGCYEATTYLGSHFGIHLPNAINVSIVRTFNVDSKGTAICYHSEIIYKLILAFLSMCLLESCGMSAACTWGLRGAFFRLVFFCDLPPCCFVGHSPLLSHMCNNSNTPCFLGMTTCACVLVVTSVPHHQRPSAITTRRLRLVSFQPNT
jgi:hypothetical protein